MSEATLAIRPVQSLKKLNPARAALTDALLKLLTDVLDIKLTSETPQAKAFVVDECLAFAILSKSGACMLGRDDSVDHVCEVLDGADALLWHIENGLGISIEPRAIQPVADTVFAANDAIILQISDLENTLFLALQPDVGQSATWLKAAESATPDLSAMPVPLSIDFEATRLPVADAERIERGDMLLLPRCVKAMWQSALPSTVFLPRQALLDLKDMTLKFGGAHYDEEEIGMSDDDVKDPSAKFSVPVTIRLPTQFVDAATLAGLHEGSTLQLGPLVQGLPVELLVGGRRIAAGEIVEVGESFAVLIDEGGAPQSSTPGAEEADLPPPAPAGEGSAA
jgi:flagellar motor switch/type III secretory pathway protein FliN